MDYRSLLLLRAARETGIIDAVTTDAATPQEIVDETGVTDRAATVVVDALEAQGFLTYVDGEGYEPTNRMLGFLTTTDLRSIGRTPHRLDVADALVDLPGTMLTDDEASNQSDDVSVNELGARRAEGDAVVRARVSAAVREAPDASTVLVIDDGPGEHAREFAARGVDVTLVETPDVVEHVEPLLAHEPVDLESRELDDPLPVGFDLLVAPRAFRTRSMGENRRFVARTADALSAGGTAVFIDTFRETAGDSTALDAELLATTAGGRVYEQATAMAWLADAGFGGVRTAPVPGTDDGAVVAEVGDGG